MSTTLTQPPKTENRSAASIIDRFVSLLAISHRINSEKNFDELLSIIASEAAKLVSAERATIFLLDKEKNELWAKVALGTEDIIRFDARLGVAGAVVVSGKSIVVDDAPRSPLFYSQIDSQTGFHTRNVLSVPLRNFRREIIGVFQVLNKADGRFSAEDEQFVEALANQAAIALENTKLMTELAIKQQELIEENQTLRREVEEKFTTRSLLGSSSKIVDIRGLIDRISDTSVSVLITGQNGTGKELTAKAIHFTSGRRRGPFVAVNCAALPEPLVESELFGIEKGVATGVERRIGRIESANAGTLFLDEIGDLSLTAQAKLLRVLQEREVEWVGGRRPVPIDVRVLAATNKDLKQEIQAGRFRQDLYFRLNVIHIEMPSLRDIRSDIPLLAMHFLRKHAQDIGRELEGFTSDAMKAMTSYGWPGNIRELENEVRRAAVMATGARIAIEDLSPVIREDHFLGDESPAEPASGSSGKSLKDRVTALEIQMIRDAMSQTGGDKRRTAKMLGLSLQGLLNKLKRYGFE